MSIDGSRSIYISTLPQVKLLVIVPSFTLLSIREGVYVPLMVPNFAEILGGTDGQRPITSSFSDGLLACATI